MERIKKYSMKERLESLARFGPLFEEPGFKFGEMVFPASKNKDVVVFPYYQLSETGRDFVKTAYELGWVLLDFNWVDWKETREARELADDPVSTERATPEQLAYLLTVIIRQERFCVGALESAFKSGLITNICLRARSLLY